MGVQPQQWSEATFRIILERMQYRRFGRTDLPMPVFSCGGMRYQYKWQDVPLADVPPENQANLEATIRRAFDLGITHIETARGYGSSERQLGLILPQLDRDRLILQTKISPTNDSAQFEADFYDSLDRLQLDHVDLLAIHGINNDELIDQSVRPGGCLEAARRLQQKGLARWIGFSTHGSTQTILKAIESNGPDGQGFDYINLHWYYIYQENWKAVQAAAARDMGLFIISPADKGGMLYDPPQKLIDLCDPIHPLVFNSLFCLHRPEVHTLSLGASCPADFELQMKTLDLLDNAEQRLGPIQERLFNAMAEATGNGDPFAISRSLPPWFQWPGQINAGVILWLRHLATGWDMGQYAKMRYNLLGNADHWFPGLNAEHIDGQDLQTILADSNWADQIPEWLAQAHKTLYEAPKKRISESSD
jgi:predicted aldo/keto reductase-like oxidoreductase